MQEDEAKQAIYENSVHVMENEHNITQCQQRVNELLKALDTAFHKSDLTFVRQARSRYIHYRNRLAIIDPTNELLDTHTSLSLLVQFALEDIDDASGKSKKSPLLVERAERIRCNTESNTYNYEFGNRSSDEASWKPAASGILSKHANNREFSGATNDDNHTSTN